jgi:pyruvate, water dikinase
MAIRWVRWFEEVGIEDVPSVGGKNASLGEMLRELKTAGVRVPGGFAVTAEAFREFLRANALDVQVYGTLAALRPGDVDGLRSAARRIRDAVIGAAFPAPLAAEVVDAYRALCRREGREGAADLDVAVRSSATAEDLPTASFAGAQETFLQIHGEAAVLDSVKRCFASLFTPRAISYRQDMGFDHAKVALSVGVQKMVRSDLGASGVMFTLDTDSGFRDVVLITSIWGFGENIVQGRVGPDEFYVHKPTLRAGFKPLVWRKIGAKELRLVYDEAAHRLENIPVPLDDRSRYSIADDDVLQLARWGLAIEEHYSRKRGEPLPMDIEWAKDGRTGELFIVQARPETVYSQKKGPVLRRYRLAAEGGTVLAQGLAVGDAIASGTARVIEDPAGMAAFEPGEVLVTHVTDPDWEPIMKIAGAIVTEHGGRTSHAAIVARELGIPAIVGAAGATQAVHTGGSVTVSCAQGETGRVYEGALRYEVEEIDPTALPRARTQIMLNVGTPEQAFATARLPNDGVGLARMEFIFASWVRVHPLALTRYESLAADVRREVDEVTRGYADKREYFIDKVSQGVGTIAAAFWPNPVILRFSDFKTNEYAHLIGGAQFEPHEENPMLGWRGASRYYHPEYKEGFLLEVAAVRRVREVFGLTNLKVMVPFCRTPEEGRRVLEVMREGGLERGRDGLEVYVMAELPSNVALAAQFAEVFDGFSIGSNDLTQLMLGVDRDSDRVAPLFDERNEAVRRSCAEVIAAAHRAGRKVGICGQAPSDYPEFAAFLVERGIDSISLNPDAVVSTKMRVLEVERRVAGTPAGVAAAS